MKAILKYEFITLANIYIRNGYLIKYRWYSNNPNHPDFILGAITQENPWNMSSLPEHCIKRIEEIEDRKIIENDDSILFYGFSDEELNTMLRFF